MIHETAKSVRLFPHLAHIVKPIFTAKSERKQFHWNAECQQAFETIKARLLQDPVVLRFPNFNKPFSLHVDASDFAMGACLFQEDGPIQFFSRTFNNAERNYSATDREFCALVNAVKYFRHIIFGYKVTIHTDHQAVISLIHRRPPANGRHARYLNTISEFDFEVVHIPGKDNVTADFLSRSVSSDSSHRCKDKNPLAQFCAVDKKDIPSLVATYHNEGHFSVTKVRKALLAAGHWFPRMRAVLHEFQKNCVICSRAKSYSNSNIPRGSLPSFPQVQPRQMVFVDIVGPLPTCRSGYRFIFTMIDAASKWLEAVPLSGIDADRTVKAFNNQWILRHGPPACVHSDNGSNFRSFEFQEFLRKCGSSQSFTTPYRPQGNGVIERQHRTLKDRLRTSLLQKGGQWLDHLQQAVYDINRTVNDVTGVAPFRFLYGVDTNAAQDWPISINNFRSSLPVPKLIYPKVNNPRPLGPRRGGCLEVKSRITDQLVRVADGRVFNLNNCRAVY
ncbi:MAG: RNase H-like domain-containing protein [Pseudomonadota bacterium]